MRCNGEALPGALQPGDLAVWDGHVAMIGRQRSDDRSQKSIGVQNDRRHGIASAHFMCPSKPSSVARDFPARAAHNIEWICPRYPNCGQGAATFETGPRVSRDRCARRPPTIDAMALQIHTQPDPDHFCETCGGPSELVSQTITPWDGNETMAREVSPWTPRCADPGCQSRIPRHRR